MSNQSTSGDGYICPNCGTYVWFHQPHTCPAMNPNFGTYHVSPIVPESIMAAVAQKVKTWDALGRCIDEFEGYGLAEASCGEYREADDAAMLKLKAAFENHEHTPL